MRRVTLITLFVCLVLVGTRLVEYSETVKAETLRIAGAGLLVASLVRWRDLRSRLRSPLDWAVLAWLAVEVLATVTSRAPLLSVFGEQEQHEGLLTSLALAGVYFATRLAGGGASAASATFDAWLAGAAVASAWALLQAVHVVPMPADRAQLSGMIRPFGPLGHPNLLGVVTSSAAAAAVARVLIESRRRALHVAVALLCVAATVATASRGAWLALLAGFAVASVLAWRAPAARPISRATGLGLAAGILGVLGVAAFAGWGKLLAGRFGEIVSPGSETGRSRIEIWRALLDAWRARPWFGHGPDTVGLTSVMYQTPGFWRHAWGEVTVHAHSIYIQTLATRGLLGVLAGLALAAATVAALARAWRSGGGTAAAIVAACAALAALGVAGAFGAWGICGALIATLLAAHAAGLGETPPAATPRRAVTVAGVAGLAAALGMAAFVANELAGSRALADATIELDRAGTLTGQPQVEARARAADLARTAARRLAWDDHGPRTEATALMEWADGWPAPGPLLAGAERAAAEAVRRVPLRAANSQALAEARLQRLRAGDSRDSSAWEAGYARAAELWPSGPYVWIGWTRARLSLGESDAALVPARRVVALYPESGLAQLALAAASLATRDTAAARAALEHAASGFWYGDSTSLARALELRAALGP